MSMKIPAGHVLRQGYAPMGRIRFQQYGGIFLPAVQRHLDTVVNMGGGAQPAPCPFGFWDGDTFVIQDGRHRFTALLIAGFESFLVSWLEPHVPGEEESAPGRPRPEVWDVVMPLDVQEDPA